MTDLSRLWGADLAEPIEPFPCDCGETVRVTYRREPWGWWMQHGENPEHMSPQWTEPFVHLPQDWVDSIHERLEAGQ